MTSREVRLRRHAALDGRMEEGGADRIACIGAGEASPEVVSTKGAAASARTKLKTLDASFCRAAPTVGTVRFH